MFTKRHIERIAQLLKDSRPSSSKYYENERDFYISRYQWRSQVESFAMLFESDKVTFNKARFLQACGYND